MKLSEEQLESVAALRGNRDFAVLMNAVAGQCSTENERLLKLPESNEYLRGQVFALTDFLETMNGAIKKLERAKQPKT